MSRTIINVLLKAGLTRERVEHLCELENATCHRIETIAQAVARHPEQNILLVCQACSRDELKTLQAALNERHQLILFTPRISQVFQTEDDANAFFDSCGFVVLEENWTDLAFKQILDETAKSNGHVAEVELECPRKLGLYSGGRMVSAISTFLGRHACSCRLYGEPPPLNATCEFSLYLAPGHIAHGKCRVDGISRDGRNGFTTARLQFTDFDGISRALLNRFVSDSLTMQNTQREGVRRTNAEYVRFLIEKLEPVATEHGFTLRALLAPFEDGYILAQFPSLMSVSSKLLTKIMQNADCLPRGSEISIRLKENQAKILTLMFEFALKNSVEIKLTDELFLVSHSRVGGFVAHEDLVVLHSQNLSLEQYPYEAHEHLAICLEGV